MTDPTSGYTDAPVELDVDELATEARENLEARVDGLVLRDGHLLTLATRELARIASQAAHAFDRALKRHAVSEMGDRLFGISRRLGTKATGRATITMVDDAGYTVDAGTLLAWQPTGDRRDDVEFETTDNLAINSGSTSGEVAIEAVDVGTDGNGIAAGEPLAVIQARPEVDSASVAEETGGGEDEETRAAHLDRLVAELELLSEAGVVAEDFGVLARRTAGVTRALVLDEYDPDSSADTDPRHVTLVPVDDAGHPVDTATADQLLTDLEAHRIVNTVLHTMEPTYTAVDTVATVRRKGGYDTADVRSACEQAVRDHIKPAHWGGGDQSPPQWQLRSTVRLLEVASVLATVDGVDFVESLTLNGAEDDVALAGDAPLPSPFAAPDSGDPWDAGSTVDATVTTP